MEEVVRRITEMLILTLRGFSAFLIIASVGLIATNSIGRYAFHNSIVWAEEVLGFALVWMVFAGAVLVTERNEHLSMSLFTENAPYWVRQLLGMFSDILLLVIASFISYQGFEAISDINYVSQAARLPLNFVNAVIPLAFAAITVILAIRIVARFPNLMTYKRGQDLDASEQSDVSESSK